MQARLLAEKAVNFSEDALLQAMDRAVEQPDKLNISLYISNGNEIKET